MRRSLATWCVRSDNLSGLAARTGGRLVGPVRAMSRARPDGVRLEWTLTMPVVPPPHGGIVPFFIDWGETAHPCGDLPDYGVRLAALSGRHPDPESVGRDLSALGVAMELRPGRPLLEACLEVAGGDFAVL